MHTNPSAADDGDARLVRVVDAWLEDFDAGDAVEPEGLAAQHPELEPQLAELVPALALLKDAALPAPSGPRPAHGILPGMRLGEFVVVREIGRGGMGVVFEAEQPALSRTVALKVLPAHATLNANAIARFRHEAGTAARLRHPGIVPILASGAADAGHYFAMELVEGVGLDLILAALGGQDPAQLTAQSMAAAIAQVLRRPPGDESQIAAALGRSHAEAACRVVIQVAEALDHAHRAGVIHRDVKPSNILVRADGSAVLVDFGLARTDGSQSLTRSHVLLGTLAYVAPERAAGGRRPADARSDIYSLGATLYELLSLQLPFRGATTEQVLAAIQRDEPVSLHKRNPRLSRDLVTIVQMALAKDPARRYPTAQAFADDLRALLDYRPIVARRSSVLRRGWSFAQRRPWLALCGLVAVVGTVAIVALAGHARGENLRAVTMLGLLQDVLGNAHPIQARGADYRVTQLLADIEESLRSHPEIAPADEASVRHLLGSAHLGLGRPDAAEPHLDAALAIRQRLFGERHELVLESMRAQQALLYTRGRYREADVIAERNLTLASELFGSADERALGVALDRADLAIELGDAPRALVIAQDAIATSRRMYAAGDPGLVAPLRALATVLQAQNRLAEAEQVFREALDIDRAVRPGGSIDAIACLLGVGGVQRSQGRFDDAVVNVDGAVALCERLLPPHHPTLATCLHHRASLLGARGALDDAEATSRRALEIRRSFGEHPELVHAMSGLATTLREKGKLADAEQLLRQAIEMHERLLGNEHPQSISMLGNLGEVLRQEGRLEEAERVLRRALGRARATWDAGNIKTVVCLGNLSMTRHSRGDLEEAEQLQRESLDMAQALLGPGSTPVAKGLHHLACIVQERGRSDEAIALFRRAVTAWEAVHGAEHARVAKALVALAGGLRDAGKVQEAESAAQRALAMYIAVLGEGSPEVAETWRFLAMISQRAGDQTQAVARYRVSVELCRRHLEPGHLQTATSLKDLASAVQRDAPAEAESLYREALEILRQHKRQGDQLVLGLLNLGLMIQDQPGRLAESEAIFREAVESSEPGSAGEVHRSSSLTSLGGNLVLQNRCAEAESHLREALRLRERTHRGQYQVFNSASLLGAALLGQGRHQEAEPLLVESCDRLLELPGVFERWRREALERVIALHDTRGETEKAAARREQLRALPRAGR